MATSIPAAAREHVKGRFHSSCTRCGVKCEIGHWHHRRSRSVKDDHQHHPCNGVWLCPSDHRWVHANPFDARASGLIVSRSVVDPSTIEVITFIGVMHLDCDGMFTFTK